MDWRDYPDEERSANKVYNDARVSAWVLDNNDKPTEIIPQAYETYKEKERLVQASNSNRYNITQSIAEAFEVFCVYEYKCDSRGRFVKTYEDNGAIYTGRKVVFYNRAIKSENPLQITYQKNLSSISRTSDTTDLYTKLYVSAVDDSVMDSGQISIADTTMNPLLDDFILNFDYLYSIGSITESQMNSVAVYKVNLRKLNQDLLDLQNETALLEDELSTLNGKLTILNTERDQARNQAAEADSNLQALPQSEPIEKTKDNLVSVTFFKDTENDSYYKAKLGLKGVIASSVSGYRSVEFDYQPVGSEVVIENTAKSKKYKQTFASLHLSTTTPTTIAANQYYGILDDTGYLSYILTSSASFSGDASDKTLQYLTLTYNESSYYKDIADTFNNIADQKERQAAALNDEVTSKQEQLDNYFLEINDKLKEKEDLNIAFERTMGGALREGYWSPENTGGVYEKINRIAEVEFTDADPDSEELGYKYTSLDNESKDYVHYYPYIEIPEALWGNTEDGLLKDLVFVLKSQASHHLTFNSADDTDEDEIIPTFSAGSYFSISLYGTESVIYFKLDKEITEPGTLTLKEENDFSLIYIPDNIDAESISFEKVDFSEITEDIIVKDISLYFSLFQLPLTLYNNSGYILAYKKGTEDKPNIPIALLNNDKLNYSGYSIIGYGYDSIYSQEEPHYTYGEVSITTLGTEEEDSVPKVDSETIVYPRIILNESNINRDSTDTFKVELINDDDTTTLERYEEYSVAKKAKEGRVYINLRISENNTFATFSKQNVYNVQYQVSHANEQLYEDAYEIALENSKPRFSYDVSISNLPHENQIIELGQLAHINDYLLGAYRMRGYVSGITYKLDEPQSDSLTFQNYKTKFEDLFATITASSEAMKNNQRSYDAAAASFDNKGNITQDILQSSLDANDIAFNFSDTSITIDDDEGIILTNQTAYSNGVYGQVALRGGGIFLSNSMDLISGRRFWNTGITPNGINASLITAGQLDTNLIRIFAGSDMAFLWNSEGLNAYKREGDGFSDNSYIRYSGEGLHYKLNGIDVLSLDWDNGLLINASEGTTQLDGELGLVIYDGPKNEAGNNWLVRIGRFKEEEKVLTPEDNVAPINEEESQIAKVIAGMRLYQDNGDGNYVPTLDTTNGGQLWLKNVLTIGGEGIDTATVGISGREENKDNENDETHYAIWAGKAPGKTIKEAAFYVKHDGSLKAENASISGDINAKTGQIGQWILSEDYLAYEKDDSKKVGLYSGQVVGWDEQAIRIFAGGSNSSNRNFYVTEAGSLFATQARLGNQDTYIELITDKESSLSLIQSDNYYPNYSGWKIDSKGHAEFENVKIRGELSTVVFKKEEVSAVGGKLYISPSQYYEKATLKVDNNDGITTAKIIVDNLNSNIFENNQKVQISGTLTQNDNNQNIQITCKVTVELDENGSIKEYYFNVLSPIENLQSGTFTLTSLSVIATGVAETEQYILIDASKEEGRGPFIDVRNKIAGTDSPPQVRLGDLTGLKDSYFRSIEGYGLYSQNAYLTGQLVLPNAGVTNQNSVGYTGGTNYDSISTNTSKAVRLWAGGESPISGGEAAPFVVTQDGTLYASKGVFSGELQTAGIIIDSDDNLDDAKHKRFYIAKEHAQSIQLSDYILNMDINGLSIFDGKIAAYSDSKNDLYGTADKYLEPAEGQTGIDKVIPYFYTYDDYKDETCDSRWVAKSGHIFNCYKIRDDKYEITSITLKDGLNFYREQTDSLDDYLNKEKEIYNATPQASFALMPNCLNYSGTKLGIKMKEGESLIADTNIRGTIGMKGKSIGKNGIIVSPAIDSKNNITIGIDIISLY